MTGDLYSFNRESEEWLPKGNVGLHHRRSAEEYQTLGRYILKAPIYRPKKLTELVEIYKAKTTESIVYIKKNYMNHWAIKDIYPLEFKAQLLGEWDCHAFSFVNKEKTFTVLGESEKGPCVLDIGNILALHFNVEKAYPTTISLAKNFVDRAIEIMKDLNHNRVLKILETMPKSQFSDSIVFSKTPKATKTRVREAIKQSNTEGNLPPVNVAQNVGFSFAKKTFPKIIANNAVTLNLDSVPRELKGNSRKKREVKDYNRIYEFMEKKSIENHKTEPESLLEENPYSKKKIRAILHPTLSNDGIKDEALWVNFYDKTG